MNFFSTPSCCCFDLETGGLIIGYLELIFSVLNFYFERNDPIWLIFTGMFYSIDHNPYINPSEVKSVPISCSDRRVDLYGLVVWNPQGKLAINS